MSYGANQYKQTSVKTANRGQVLIMLYEGAIKHVKRATLAIDARDIPGKCAAIGKVHDIVNELNNTLDFEVGGNIARDLERLYTFMAEQLVKANAQSQPQASKEILLSVEKLLSTLLEGWRGAVEQVNKGMAK